MKKRFALFLVLTLTLIGGVFVSADEVIISKNGNLKIYERFIDKANLDNLGSLSIWKYNDNYKETLETSLNREEPLYTIIVKGE